MAFGIVALRPQAPIGAAQPKPAPAPQTLTDEEVAAMMAEQEAPGELTDADIAAMAAQQQRPDYERLREIPPPEPPATPDAAESESWLPEMPTLEGMYKGGKDFVVDAWSGDARRDIEDKDTPELPVSDLSRSITLGLGLDDDMKLDIIRARYPNARAFKDKFGNVLIDVSPEDAVDMGVKPGRYYLNKPGASMQDAFDFGVLGGFAGLGLKAVAPAAKALLGTGVVGQLTGGAGGMAAGSLMRNATADVAGANPDYAKDAAIEGALGGAFSIPGVMLGYAARNIVKPAAAKVSRALGITRPPQYSNAAGELTGEGLTFMEKTGVDPRDLTPEAQAYMQKLLDQAVDPGVAARAAGAKSLPQEVPLSKGDVTQDVAEQRFEESARQGMFGNSAKNTMDDFRARQQQALQNNAEEIAGRIGSPQGKGVSPEQITQQPGALGQRKAVGAPTATADSAAAELRLRLAAIRDQAKTNYRSVYDQARQHEARVHGGDGLVTNIKRELSEFNPKLTKDAMTMLDELEQIVKGSKGQPVDIRAYEMWVQQVNNAMRGADPANAAALAKMKRVYASYLDDALATGRVQGDPKAVALWRQARALRKDFAQKFESDPNIRKMLELAPDGSLAFKMTPTEVVNGLLAGDGLAGKKGAAQTLQKLFDLVGKDSPEAKQLKQAFFWRLLQGGNEMARGGERVNISGQKMFSVWSQAWRRNPEFLRTLFTPEELKLINAYVNIARLATSRQPGAVNNSGTAYVTRGLDLLLGQNTSVFRTAMGPLAKFLRFGQGDARVHMNISGRPPRPPLASDDFNAALSVGTNRELRGKKPEGQ